jgi:tight adherence protein C
METAILAFAVVFVLVAGTLLLVFHRQTLGARLSKVIIPRTEGTGRTAGPPTPEERFRIRRPAEPPAALSTQFRKVDLKLATADAVIRHRLIMARYRGQAAAENFPKAKIIVPLVLCLLAFLTGVWHWNGFIVFGLSLPVGYMLPDYWLDWRIREREQQIQEGLPDLLDLLVVCLEAGLSMDQAAVRASEEMRHSRPAVADEIGLVLLEIRAGQPRLEAWKHMAERTRVEAITMLVSILVQSDQFGTGISRTLRTHSETMRAQARNRVEELVAKTTVKLVFPLVLFLFPAIFIVVLGPAVITVIAAFK